jgi:hypothetical protein
MVVVLIFPLNVVGQSCGQVAALSPALQSPSPQREAGSDPGVPAGAGWPPQDARMNKQLKARIGIRKGLILSSGVNGYAVARFLQESRCYDTLNF